ncbi:hypothetical protein K469DRAFT_715076 [Zopfia rhizophila CBS 207.26]|uniref:Uncharacterized protein n=1 Tax=Zopfia rhizophila CBS 207.26 TaxID=1314779 RepID=A0A6A6EPY9_9PEZI|nr:hypothetical protein K469DRAFT_715076 [Zopfia rhizophila CBS 207.26]
MDIVPGLPLTDTWTRMSEEAKATTQQDLSNYLGELRSISPRATKCSEPHEQQHNPHMIRYPTPFPDT